MTAQSGKRPTGSAKTIRPHRWFWRQPPRLKPAVRDAVLSGRNARYAHGAAARRRKRPRRSVYLTAAAADGPTAPRSTCPSCCSLGPRSRRCRRIAGVHELVPCACRRDVSQPRPGSQWRTGNRASLPDAERARQNEQQAHAELHRTPAESGKTPPAWDHASGLCQVMLCLNEFIYGLASQRRAVLAPRRLTSLDSSVDDTP